MSAVTTRRRWVCTLAVLLASCGGGGGGGSSGGGGSGGGSDNSWLSFSPAAVDLTVYEDEPAQTFRVTATSSKTISDVFNVAIIDNSGILDASATSVQANSEYSYTASLKLLGSLPAGTRTGNLEVRLCRDDPRICANPIEGSPWQLPYTLTVKSSSNLTPLQPLAGAQDWTMFQGSARHTGYVPAQLDPTTFSRRFRYAPPNVHHFSEAAVADGLAVVATRLTTGEVLLNGISESTGAEVWTSLVNSAPAALNDPALFDGKAYVMSSDYRTGTTFWTFHTSNGTRLNDAYVGTEANSYLAPTVNGGAIYLERNQGSMVRFNADGYLTDWNTQSGLQAPAVVGSFAYAMAVTGLYVLNVGDGSTAFKIDDPHYDPTRYDYASKGAAVLADGGVVYASQILVRTGYVIRFDTEAQLVTWSAGIDVKSQPVPVGNTVYVLDGRELHALSAQTGELLWSWQASSDFTTGYEFHNAPLLVVGHHAFFSTAEGTQALDLNTRKIVWSDPASGRLAVSANGILYISGANEIVAVNLH